MTSWQDREGNWYDPEDDDEDHEYAEFITREEFKAANFLKDEETILEEAQRLVHGDRGEAYGHPAIDFTRTAGMWNALFGWDATPERVAMAMICVKLSREENSPKRDNRADIAGYAETLDMVMEYENDCQ